MEDRVSFSIVPKVRSVDVNELSRVNPNFHVGMNPLRPLKKAQKAGKTARRNAKSRGKKR